jgi:hypothetical protein
MPIASHHLPGLADIPVRTERAPWGAVEVEHAALTPELLARAVESVRAARRQTLAGRPVRDVIDAIVRMATEWRRPESTWRARALATLPAVTGLSAEMVAETLARLFEPYTEKCLWSFVEAETGGADVLDGFAATPWGARHAVGPDLLAHVAAGNVPGLALPVLVSGLLAKSAIIIKPAAGEPVLTALIARSLTAVAPEIGGAVAVAYWPGGTAELDAQVLPHADVVVVEGNDESVAAARAMAPGRTLGFGRRVSLAVVAREAAGKADCVAADIARDVSMYDQHGCLSPHVVYVEAGGDASAVELADALAQALLSLGQSLPRGELTTAEHTAVHRFRAEAEWQSIHGQDVRIFGDPSGTGATVVYESDPRFEPTCAHRAVRVKPLERLEDLPAALGDAAPLVEAVGAAGPPERIRNLARILATSSTVSRICPLGRMQAPPLDWRHGGIPRLGALLRWIDLER